MDYKYKKYKKKYLELKGGAISSTDDDEINEIILQQQEIILTIENSEKEAIAKKIEARNIAKEAQNIAKEAKELSEKSKELSEKSKELSEKSKELSEKSKELSEKSKKLSEKSKKLSKESKKLSEESKELSEINKADNVEKIKNIKLNITKILNFCKIKSDYYSEKYYDDNDLLGVNDDVCVYISNLYKLIIIYYNLFNLIFKILHIYEDKELQELIKKLQELIKELLKELCVEYKISNKKINYILDEDFKKRKKFIIQIDQFLSQIDCLITIKNEVIDSRPGYNDPGLELKTFKELFEMIKKTFEKELLREKELLLAI